MSCTAVLQTLPLRCSSDVIIFAPPALIAVLNIDETRRSRGLLSSGSGPPAGRPIQAGAVRAHSRGAGAIDWWLRTVEGRWTVAERRWPFSLRQHVVELAKGGLTSEELSHHCGPSASTIRVLTYAE